MGVRDVVSAGVGLCRHVGLGAARVLACAKLRVSKIVIAFAFISVASAAGVAFIPLSGGSGPLASDGSSEAPMRSTSRRDSLLTRPLDWGRFPSLDYANVFSKSDQAGLSAAPATYASSAAAVPDQAAPATSSSRVVEVVKVMSKGTGLASFYRRGVKTANGEPFDPSQLTAAHRTLPFGTKLRVTNLTTGKSVLVRVNDRGPYVAGRVVDLSYSAAESLGMIEQGVTKVHLAVVQ